MCGTSTVPGRICAPGHGGAKRALSVEKEHSVGGMEGPN